MMNNFFEKSKNLIVKGFINSLKNYLCSIILNADIIILVKNAESNQELLSNYKWGNVKNLKYVSASWL